jgi:hypothetical protein
MAKRLAAVLGLILLGSILAVRAQQFPLWEQLLQHYGGKSDQTPVPTMIMGNHMQMSLKAASQPGDEQRAQDILAAARQVLARYADVNKAQDDGYKRFGRADRVGDEVHYTNYRYGRQAEWHVNYDHPTSILYKRTPQGMQAVGVMYTAPQDATPQDLNAIAPLSIATWHRHVDFCGGPKSLPFDEQFGPHAQFGMQGSIHTEEACNAAHGLWIPVVFGWMTHVYPSAKNPGDIWGGMEMRMDANTDSDEMNMKM